MFYLKRKKKPLVKKTQFIMNRFYVNLRLECREKKKKKSSKMLFLVYCSSQLISINSVEYTVHGSRSSVAYTVHAV